MSKKYTKSNFQKDLLKLSNMIENYNVKGGEKNEKDEKRTFKVVEKNGKKIQPYGEYKIKKNQPVGPEKAAEKALRKICWKIREPKNKGGNGGSWMDCEGITIKIEEKTRGSSHKVYGPYIARVEKLSAQESKTRTAALRKVLTDRYMKPKNKGGLELSRSAAEKKAKKNTKKVTHRLKSALVKNNK